MSNFTFFHNVFYATCILKSFNPFPNKPWFLRVYQYKTFENTVGKGEIAPDKQSLLFPQCFLPHVENSLPFSSKFELSSTNSVSLEESKICWLGKVNSNVLVVVCSFLEFGTVSKCCIWEWVNPFPNKS